MTRLLVVLVSGVSWDGVKGSERQLGEALAGHVDVLWVDPPISPVTPARYRGVDGRQHRRTGARKVAPGIVRLTPAGPPGLTRPGIRAVTWPAVRWQVARTVRHSGRVPAAVVACTPHDLLGRWGPGVVDVLYGTDDWVAGAALMSQHPERVLREERAALARADVVLAVGPELAQRWREMGADPVVFPNGCDPGAYDAAGVAELPASLPRPVAGMIGQLSERVDIAMLEAVADRDIGLLLVGPRDHRWLPDRVDTLLARPGVHHTGALPFEELPPWLAAIDVGLTPYADTAFNRASFPLKTLEYLAAGRPVVGSDLPATRRLADLSADVTVAADADGLAAAVASVAAAGSAPGDVARRRTFASGYSWTARAEQLLQLIADNGRGA